MQLKEREGIPIPNRPIRLPFPAQILTTVIIVVALGGAARLASSEEDSRAFDEAAEQTWFQFEAAARGIEATDTVSADAQVPVEREEP